VRGLLLGLLACGLACAVCLMSDPLTRFLEYRTQARLNHANRLDYLVGTVEPLFLAEDHWNFLDLSPDGRWLEIAKAVRDDWSREEALMDMETYRIYNIEYMGGGDSYWVDNRHLILGGSVVKVPELKYWRLKELPHWEDDPTVLKQLAGVSRVMAVEGKLPVSYVVISTDPAYPYTVDIRAGDKTELGTILGDIPYTIVPESVWRANMGQSNKRVYSPDGKYFVSGGEYSAKDDTYYPQSLDKSYSWGMLCVYSAENQYCPGLIFDTETEALAAMAGKKGWSADILGWAPDSSGVYLQFGPLGGGYGFAPAGFPTYKLLVPGQKPSGKRPIVVNN